MKRYEENQHKFYTDEEKKQFVHKVLWRRKKFKEPLAHACAKIGIQLRGFQEWRDEMIKCLPEEAL